MDSSIYRCHDYKHLVARWRKVARAAGVKLEVWGQASGYDLLRLMPRRLKRGESPLVYISAGIHGDEPAATEGLIRWAERCPEQLTRCLVFPCLNPWGLVNNSRLDGDGLDLNRMFHRNDVELVRLLKQFIAPYRFAASICLHEDYDGEGLYLYELEGTTPFWGEALLDQARAVIPIEGRLLIDGRRPSQPGLIRQRLKIKRFPEVPEAVYLQLHHTPRSFTFETPSEFALETRVKAQEILLEAALHRAISEASAES